MTDHLYTPAGIKNGSGSAKYKGGDAAIVDLLQLSIEKGIDIDFDHGTVSYSETGYGEGEDYGYFGGGSYSWVETTDSDLSLQLSTWGRVRIADEEMIPGNFFESQDPEETFEPTGNEGVNAERQYADADAIVVWPRSQRWSIVTDNDTTKMCNYLLKACTKGATDSEPKEECIRKAKMLIPRIASGSASRSSYKFNSSNVSYEANVTTLMKCLVLIGDEALAVNSFLTSYLASNPKKTPDAILKQLATFVDLFGSGAIRPCLLEAVNGSRYSADPTGAANFLLKCISILRPKKSADSLVNDLVVGFVDSICPVAEKDRRVPSKKIDSFPLKSILGLFTSDETPVSNAGLLAKRVLEGIVWASCQTIQQPARYSFSMSGAVLPAKGPTLLVGSSLAVVCETFGWTAFEAILVDASEAMCVHGNAASAVSFVDDLAPTSSPPDSDADRSRICKRMASIACEKVLAMSARAVSSSLEIGRAHV